MSKRPDDAGGAPRVMSVAAATTATSAPTGNRVPNAITIEAMREVEEGHLPSFDSVHALFDDLHAEDQADDKVPARLQA